jgi:hypothetical protein
MNGSGGKLFCILALLWLAGVSLPGCTTRSNAAAQAHEAFIAGQNAALRQQQLQAAQTPGVTVIGPVQHPRVPWVAGLTLAQAIATATYLDSQSPKTITIFTQQGEKKTLSASALLNGTDIPLQPGDVIEIQP